MSFQDESKKLDEILKENENNLRRLIEQLKTSLGVIPFVGAGLSRPFGFPLWTDFLITRARLVGIEEKIQERIYAGKYEDAAEDLLNTMGNRAFNDAIEDAFGDHILDGKKLDGAILLIPQLAAGPVITTNFDHTLENVFKNAGRPFDHVVWGIRVDMFTKALSQNKSYLIKIHGDVEDRTDRVLTLADYRKHYGDSGTKIDRNLFLPSLLQQMLTSRTILFVGCSLNKDRTVESIGKVARENPAIAHYAIIEEPESNEEIRNRARNLSDYGIRPIWYPRGQHDLIEQILSYLVEQICVKSRQKNRTPDSNLSFSRASRQIEPKNAERDKIIKETFTNSMGMEFVLIPAGEFIMGSEEYGWDLEKPVRTVTINKPFYLGVYPVTQRQWEELMEDNPSYFEGNELPVERVSWNDVQEFIIKLNEQEGENKYYLPSEAEWEYAIRAGTTTSYFFADDDSKLEEYAWYYENSESKTHPVGQKNPNPWGLYDMIGNVWEWIQDTWHDSYRYAPTDSSAWESRESPLRVVRGGCWGSLAANCRSAARAEYPDSTREEHTVGFRIMKVL
ncbi:MAG: SUMF1/EgtB/PvdO family nonheme iron enzyme [Candidatus Methanoperedens sp.]|nr:SUMF1/EgtB/PvdO family nonheme iron enzyme [Candidatus Methanoperedens sp.]